MLRHAAIQSIALCALAAGALAAGAMAQATQTAPPGDDANAVYSEAARGFILQGLGKSSDTGDPASSDDPWLRYLSATAESDAVARERALETLLDDPLPDPLRRIVLCDMASSLEFKSRRAQFIRRYGFYANWFNRFAYTTSRALQGNVAAFGQLAVDGVFDAFGRGEATPAERRLYRYLRELEREGRAGDADRERLAELESKVERALAEVDLERAQWALDRGDPELAEFYARGALGRRSEFKKAETLKTRAAKETAARRRARLASLQVGYPDREPPVEPSSPSLLRAVVSGQRSELLEIVQRRAVAAESPTSVLPSPAADDDASRLFLDRGDAFLAWMLTTLSDQDPGSIIAMREWAGQMNEARALPEGDTDWLRRLMLDPRFNADIRFAQAEATRRTSVAKFIFLGPDSAREQAYKAGSRGTQLYDALGSIGIFYVFQAFYRAGLAAFSPPPPADEMYDAAANFLHAAPLHPDSREIAAWLAEEYRAQGRFDQARELLARYNLLDPAKVEELDMSQARRAIQSAEALRPGHPRRFALLEDAQRLARGTGLEARALRLAARQPRDEDEIVLDLDWRSVQEWSPAPLPAGLPGESQWFDGDAGNGEADSASVRVTARGPADDSVDVAYPIRREGMREVVSESVEIAKLDPALARWIRMVFQERLRTQRELAGLGRARIPYEITGGAGVSGLDFYPRLKPIELAPGDLRLYQED